MRSLIISIVFFSACNSNFKIRDFGDLKPIRLVEFCDLDRVPEGEIIETIGTYSGVDEYWTLSSNTGCNLDHKIYLNTEDFYHNTAIRYLNRKFKRLYGNYSKYTLELRIIGRLEKSHEEPGFGHLGHLKIQITPYEIEILDKQKIETDELY